MISEFNEIKLSYQPDIDHSFQVNSSKIAADCLRPFYQNINLFEECVCMFLNNNINIIGLRRFSSGDLLRCVIDVGLICSTALLTRSAAVIISHCHPSGTLKISEQDKIITKKIQDGLGLFDIKLYDHIILTNTSHISFADSNMI